MGEESNSSEHVIGIFKKANYQLKPCVLEDVTAPERLLEAVVQHERGRSVVPCVKTGRLLQHTNPGGKQWCPRVSAAPRA